MIEAIFPGARPTYQRRKRDTSVIAYSYRDGSPAGYVRRYADRRHAEVALAKTRAFRLEPGCHGVDIAALDDGFALAFPNDIKLRNLRWVASLRKLKRTLAPLAGLGQRVRAGHSTMRVVRYKPERRLVAELDLAFGDDVSIAHREHFYLRYSAAGGSAELARVVTALGSAGVPVAPPVYVGAGDRLYLDRAVAGVPLPDALGQQSVDAATVAEILHVLHRSHIRLPRLKRAPVADLAALEALAPSLAPMAQRCADALARRQSESGATVVCHGDLHFEQFVVGDRVHLVDFERAGWGPPERDLGQLLAHAFVLDLRAGTGRHRELAAAVVDAYRPARDDALALSVAGALVEQALMACRHFEPDGYECPERYLDTAIAVAERSTTRWWN